MQRRILIGGFAAAAPLAVLPADAAPRPATAVEVLRTSLSNTDTSGDWLRPGERLRLEGYRKKYSRAETRFLDEPDKSNGCTEGADAFRQYAQAKELGLISTKATNYVEPPPPDWRT